MQVPQLKGKYGHGYNFDLAKLHQDFLRHFCRLGSNPYEFLCELRDDLQGELCIAAGEQLR